jgi:hypothetical protein
MATKQDVQEVLKRRSVTIFYAADHVEKYLLQPEVMPLLINSIVEKALKDIKHTKGKPTTVDLYKYFYESTRTITEGTPFGRTPYAAQQFLKNIWNSHNIQNAVIGHISRNGYKPVTIPEKQQEVLRKQQKELQLQQQAYKMRVGRAVARVKKLKAQGKNVEVRGDKVVDLDEEAAARKAAKPIKQTATPATTLQPAVKTAPTPKYKGKEMTAAQLAYIATLKGL